MTREELEKAIKNGESVWCLSDIFKEPVEIKVREHTDKFIDRLNFYCYTDKNGEKREHYIDNLYKTKAEALHYMQHANITRTETLPFLTWEEFKEIGQISFTGKDKKEYILKKDITWSNNKYTLVDCLKIVNETDFTFSKYFDYTEENFYKAYDECVRLFKGE